MTLLTRRTRTVIIALAALAVLASCGTAASFPVREADARGTLTPYAYDPTETDVTRVVVYRLIVEEGEYPYYRDAQLSFDEDTVIRSTAGESLTLDDLSAGLLVEIWTGACAESLPVQCGVTHVRLTQVD